MEHEQPRLTGFMEDHEGKRSSMRLMSILSLLTAIFLAIGPMVGLGPQTESQVIWSFLLFGFAPKVGQAAIERWRE